MLRYFLIGYLLLVGWISILHSQTLTLKLDTVGVFAGDTIAFKVVADSDFEGINAMQFSLNWDASVLQFEESQSSNVQLGVTQLDEIAEGKIRAIWDRDGESATLEPGATIFEIGFIAIGESGESSPISITRDPLSILILGCCDEAADNIYAPLRRLEPMLAPGRIEIVEGLQLGEAIINQLSCAGNADASIQPIIRGGIPPFNYRWEGPNDFVATSDSITGLSAGIYGLTVTDANQQEQITSYEIVESQPIELSLVVQDTRCDNPSGSIRINPIGGNVPYQFDLEGMTQTDSIFDRLNAGNYLLQIEDANACTTDTIIEIAIPAGPTFEISAATPSACEGESTTLGPVNLVDGQMYQYNWLLNNESLGTTEEIDIIESGRYELTVSDTAGCTTTASIDFNFSPPVNLELTTPKMAVCQGEEITLQVNTNGASVQWQDTSGTLQVMNNALEPSVTPQFTTLYTATATNGCGTETRNILIETIPVVVSAGNDTCITEGMEVQLNASGGTAYQWLESEYPVSDESIPNPISNPQDSTTYRVAITHASGCVVEDEVIVAVADDPLRFIERVNMITPNGDGFNDVLEFGNLGKFANIQLKVLNRWGRTIYDKIGYQLDDERWDGTFRGKPVPDGTYFYILIINQNEIKQTITVLRK